MQVSRTQKYFNPPPLTNKSTLTLSLRILDQLIGIDFPTYSEAVFCFLSQQSYAQLSAMVAHPGMFCRSTSARRCRQRILRYCLSCILSLGSLAYHQDQHMHTMSQPSVSNKVRVHTLCHYSMHVDLKLKVTQYPAIHTNYSLSNCTISNKKDFNRSSDFLVIN